MRTKSLGSSRRQTNDCEKDAAVGYALVDRFSEVASRLNCGDIHEYGLIAEAGGQVVE
jgi:hypothetical protein